MTVPPSERVVAPFGGRHLGVWLLSLPVRFYRLAISPLLPPSCRFHPSCSAYCLEALARHGAGRGLGLTVRRLARCHPFHPGGLDPVPEAGDAPRGE